MNKYTVYSINFSIYIDSEMAMAEWLVFVFPHMVMISYESPQSDIFMDWNIRHTVKGS